MVNTVMPERFSRASIVTIGDQLGLAAGFPPEARGNDVHMAFANTLQG
jgi:hypothetical protein